MTLLVLEGMPGAGKTTLMAALFERHWPHILLFPEASVPDRVEGNVRRCHAFLDEDRDRQVIAAQAGAGLQSVSDRSVLGVWAYYRTLHRTGSITDAEWLELDRTIMESPAWIHLDVSTIYVSMISVDESITRRSYSPRNARWFDSSFLHEYALSWNELSRFLGIERARLPSMSEIESKLELADASPRSILPQRLICTSCLCERPVSRTVHYGHVEAQMYTSAIHWRAFGQDEVNCSVSAASVAAIIGVVA